MSIKEKQSLVGTISDGEQQKLAGTMNVGDMNLEPNAVRYCVQYLSDEQKAQARKNIGIDELPNGNTDYNNLENKPIERIESLNGEHLVNFRDLESGQYILYGYFSPYENSDISLSADNSMVSVIRKNAGSHIICLDPLNAKIVFFEILVDETAEKGFTYTRTIIPILEVYKLIDKVGNLEELNTTDKNDLVSAINSIETKSPTVTINDETGIISLCM